MAADEARPAGDRIGPYALVRRLGRGGMGEVWEAVLHGPAGFEKPVAVKVLPPERLRDPALLEALQREARLGARLQHPNVVGTLGLSEHDGVWVLALELVRGASLVDLVRATGALPGRAVVEVGVQTAAGLAHAHEAGLVHRDVKLANLLVDRTGLVKLADLGISMLGGTVDRGAGTVGYMPPEQAAGRAEPRSDLFALGVALMALATGQRPFGTSPEAAAAVRRIEDRLQDGSLLGPIEHAVPGLGEVVRRCLRADPGDRWPDARTLGDALAALRTHQPPGPTLLALLARARPGLAVEPTPTPLSEAPTRLVPTGDLPVVRDRFVGREDEVRELASLLHGDDRLVVLLGPGGMGKTRLALEVARTVGRELAGGAWFHDLSEARSVDEVCAAVARRLRIDLERQDPAGQLGRAIAAKGRALVVVDNLEQCVEALPATLGRWLDLAPDAVFLGTSRVAPSLRGERRVPLGPLGPEEAQALFRERASRPVREDEAADARELCRALEGLPLAIELAAARVALLGVGRIRARLSLSLLAGGGRELPERHRSLAASLDWSAQLLSPIGQAALGQLAVFEGPFALEAAEAVLDVPGCTDAVGILGELADASLLRVDRGGRFSMLGVVREHARGHAPPADQAAAEQRHGAWFAQLGTREALQALVGPGGVERRKALQSELDDLIGACRRATARGDGEVAVATLRAAWAVLELQGPIAVGVDLAEAALALPGLGVRERATAAGIAGRAHLLGGRPRIGLERFDVALAGARALADRGAEGVLLIQVAGARDQLGQGEAALTASRAAVALLRDVGNRHQEGVALGNLGVMLYQRGRWDEAERMLEDALATQRELGDRRAEGIVLGNLATLRFGLGRAEEAMTLHLAALALHREVGNRRFESQALGTLAALHHRLGRYDEAGALFAEALAVVREVGQRHVEGITLSNLALLLAVQGRHDEAREHLRAALAIHREVGNRRSEGIVLGNLGEFALADGDAAEARARCLEALAIHREVGNREFVARIQGVLAQVDVGEGDLGSAATRLDEAEALIRAVGEPIQLAEVRVVRGELLRLQGDLEGARACLAEAEPFASARPALAESVEHLRSRLAGG